MAGPFVGCPGSSPVLIYVMRCTHGCMESDRVDVIHADHSGPLNNRDVPSSRVETIKRLKSIRLEFPRDECDRIKLPKLECSQSQDDLQRQAEVRWCPSEQRAANGRCRPLRQPGLKRAGEASRQAMSTSTCRP